MVKYSSLYSSPHAPGDPIWKRSNSTAPCSSPWRCGGAPDAQGRPAVPRSSPCAPHDPLWRRRRSAIQRPPRWHRDEKHDPVRGRHAASIPSLRGSASKKRKKRCSPSCAWRTARALRCIWRIEKSEQNRREKVCSHPFPFSSTDRSCSRHCWPRSPLEALPSHNFTAPVHSRRSTTLLVPDTSQRETLHSSS